MHLNSIQYRSFGVSYVVEANAKSLNVEINENSSNILNNSSVNQSNEKDNEYQDKNGNEPVMETNQSIEIESDDSSEPRLFIDQIEENDALYFENGNGALSMFATIHKNYAFLVNLDSQNGQPKKRAMRHTDDIAEDQEFHGENNIYRFKEDYLDLKKQFNELQNENQQLRNQLMSKKNSLVYRSYLVLYKLSCLLDVKPSIKNGLCSNEILNIDKNHLKIFKQPTPTAPARGLLRHVYPDPEEDFVIGIVDESLIDKIIRKYNLFFL